MKNNKKRVVFLLFKKVCTFKTEHESLIQHPAELVSACVYPSDNASSSNLRLSPRPISKCQLNALLHLHLIPIYLVVFKGSY